MPALRALVREAFRTEEHTVDWPSGAAGALAVAGPLAAGLALGERTAALVAAIGGLHASLCVPRARLRDRLWWGVLAVAGAAGGVALARVAGPGWGVVPATLAWLGGWAFVRAAGPEGALVSFSTSAVFVVVAGVAAGPAPLPPLASVVAWFFAGALPGLALMVAVRRRSGRGAYPMRGAVRVVAAALRGDRVLRAHAGRVAGAAAIGTVAYRVIDLPHGAWIPLTTLAVLQPTEHATWVRAVQRAVGTAGGAAVVVVVTLTSDSRWVLVAACAGTAFGLYALAERGYVWLVVLLTPTVLLMLSAVDFQGDHIAFDRIGGSFVGILLGLAAGEAARWIRPPGASRSTTPPSGR